MRHLALVAVFFLVYNFSAFGQHGNYYDLVMTKKGASWKGKVVTEADNDTVVLLTDDSILHYFSYKDIADIKYGITKPVHSPGTGDSTSAKSKSNRPIIYSPDVAEKKRKIGLGLTIAGPILTVWGTIFIVVQPENTTTYSGSSYAGVHFSNLAAVGLVLDLAGIPMLIAGAITLSKVNRQRKRAGENITKVVHDY